MKARYVFSPVCTCRAVFASAPPEVRTGESSQTWRCGNSRGVISCLRAYGNEAHLSLSTLNIKTHSHAHLHNPANMYPRKPTPRTKHVTIRIQFPTACANHMQLLTVHRHGSRIQARRQPGKQTQLFAQLKVSQSWASQNLLWTLKAKPRTGRHTRTRSQHTQGGWK